MATGYVPLDNDAINEPSKTSSPDSQPPPYSHDQVPAIQTAPNPTYPAQPQVVVLTRPQRTVNPAAERRRRRAAVICGIGELLHGAALLILGFVLISHADVTVGIPVFVACPAFITAVLVFATAILSLFAGLRNHRSCFIGTLVMAIITSIISGSCFMYFVVMCGEADNTRRYDITGRVFPLKTLAHIFGFAFAVHLSLTVLCIVQSSYACAVLCSCCRPNDPTSGAKFAYMAHPDQNGQLVFGGQGLPVIDLGRQNIPTPVVMNEGVA